MSTQKNEHNLLKMFLRFEELTHCAWYGNVSTQAEESIAEWERLKREIPEAIQNRRITPPTDTTGSGREGETPETDAFSARLIPKNGRGEPLYMQALTEWRELSERLERQRDAAIAQLEALRRDGERLDWLERVVTANRGGGIDMIPDVKIIGPTNHCGESGTFLIEVEADAETLPFITVFAPTLRAAIDSAQRQEGR